MQETIFPGLTVGLTVVALTGLTIIAYRHAEGYLRIYGFLSWIMAVTIAAIFAWNFAMTEATLTLLDIDLTPDISKAIRSTMDDRRADLSWADPWGTAASRAEKLSWTPTVVWDVTAGAPSAEKTPRK